MFKREESSEVCEKCGQPRGAHTADCPVFQENLDAVKEEYNSAQRIKNRKDAIKRRDPLPEDRPERGVTFKSQMRDVDNNTKITFDPRSVAVTEITEVMSPEHLREEIKGIMTSCYQKLGECGRLIQDLDEDFRTSPLFKKYQALGMENSELIEEGEMALKDNNMGKKELADFYRRMFDFKMKVMLFKKELSEKNALK
jgi:hypothetical protein